MAVSRACSTTLRRPPSGYASALVAPLGYARVVLDHFHGIKLANAVVDQICRRTQQATLGHRGRNHDRSTASASCCRPLPSSSPAEDEYGDRLGWTSVTDRRGVGRLVG
jgi:Transposase